MAMRLAFVGNCQVAPLRAAAQALLPDAVVEDYHAGGSRAAEVVLERIRGADYVVTNVPDRKDMGALLGQESLAAQGMQALYLPPFMYPALHGDVINLSGLGGRAVEGPSGAFHSRIALAAFHCGVPVSEAPALYNAHVFQALGYPDAIEPAWQAVLRRFARQGFDLAPHVAGWKARDVPFMHTGYHPAIFVSATLATLALEKLGLVAPGTAPPEGVEDSLLRAQVFPVYPEIARLAGVPARTELLVRQQADVVDRSLSLAEFLARSYTLYEEIGAAALATPEIGAHSQTLRALLAAASYAPPRRSIASDAPI